MGKADGLVVAVNEYDPYGVPLQGGGSPYGYTGEWWEQDVDLLYLRARWYDPDTGRFVTQDPWMGNVMLPGTLNSWNYVVNNPISQIDPAGTGPVPLILHLLTLPAGEAVAMARTFYSKAGPLRVCFLEPEHGHSPREMTVDDLLTDYVCERGPSHLYFDGDARLTQQLARTAVIQRYREEFYLAGGEKKSGRAYFEAGEFLSATIDTLREGDLTRFVVLAPLNITHFLGTFDYEIRRSGPDTARFQIDNTTDLESGTRIPPELGGVHPRWEAEATSVEQLLKANPFLSPVPLWLIVATNPVISVLEPKSRQETSFLAGGGTMKQTFIWQEQYLRFACEESPLPITSSLLWVGRASSD